MIIDARSVPGGTVIESELCIVGAGAAGITLAREFINAPTRVVLLESGGMEFEPDTQELYEGKSIDSAFIDLAASRLRYFGGTTNHWGGWCLPLDPIDFEPREHFPYHGWPFSRADLDPWYQRAQDVCQIGPFDYRPSNWLAPDAKIPSPFSGPEFECKILQENWLRFGPVYGPDLRRAPHVTVYLHANAFHFDAGENEAEVRELSVKTLAGDGFTVRARYYVVAAGGIENARLLLASGKEGGAGLGNARDLVGRFFMVHPVYSGGTIVPSNPYRNFDFQTRDKYARFKGRRLFIPFIGLSAASMRRRQLPAILMHWTYQFSPVRDTMDAMQRLAVGEGPGGSTVSDLSRVVGNLDGVAGFVMRKAFFGDGMPIEAVKIGCTSEQQPNPQSRVLLGSRRDRLGMREVTVDWRLTPEDKSKAVATVRLLGTEIGRAGFGRLRSSFGDDGAWPADFSGNEHHMGTTRMHRDPAHGVVDQDCRLHSVANMYVAGSSVFPTGGANNPTLTIVALALRLADHLKQQLA